MRRLAVVGQDRPRRSLDEDKDAPVMPSRTPCFSSSRPLALLLFCTHARDTTMAAVLPRRRRPPRTPPTHPDALPRRPLPPHARNRAAAPPITAGVTVYLQTTEARRRLIRRLR
jgi:hypothetical protein